MKATYAEILNTVVENGRLTLGTLEELENEIEFEATEQGLDDDEVQEAIKFAKNHYQF